MTLKTALLAGSLLMGPGAWAEDNVVLIQLGPTGYTLWHGEGALRLEDDEILEIMVSAQPEGGAEVITRVGPARAYVRGEAVEIRFPTRQGDNALLVDRDACGHIQPWHVEGARRLTEEQLTEIMLSALPEGGARLRFGDEYAKGFVMNLGVTATFWKVTARK